MQILVTAASREGSTLEIAEAIAAGLRRWGISVTVAAPSSVEDVRPFDGAVIGSAVYGGHWLEQAADVVRRHAEDLRGRRVWLFSSGPIGNRLSAEAKELPELIRLSGAREHRSFGGNLAANRLSPIRRLTLHLGGLAGDWRQWTEIDAWASTIAGDLGRRAWFRRLEEETFDERRQP